MKTLTLFGLPRALCLVAALALFQPAVGAKGGVQEARFVGRYINGTVVGIGGRNAGRTRPLRLIIDRYTSSEGVARLNESLQRGGQDELLRTLSGMDAGRIQVGTGVGVPANAIIATPQSDGGTRLVVLFERNVALYERRYGTRSEDYRFGYAEIYLGRNRKGEGTFIAAARIRLRDGNTWEVEDFGAFPARILGAQASGGGGRAR